MGGDDPIVLEGAAKHFGAQTALHPTDLVITRGQAALETHYLYTKCVIRCQAAPGTQHS